ncbi:MAG: PH domain-containing protein [Phaeodactylibacter sp.]|uniref:PH domain-containing protein n=1 Tax=Phaeodactylibacter sp. TaxID=1940289 RepID=UPI0032ED68DD
MKKNEASFLAPRRQAQAAIVIFIYNFVVRILRAAWPILLVFLFRSNKEQSNTELLMNAAVLIGGLFSLGVSVIAYYRYFFHLEEDQLVIQKGVFNRSLTKLPFERIQNLYIEQNVLHRLLGVVSLRVDSAGSSGHEVTIDALERQDAEAMRAYVLEQKQDDAGTESAEGRAPLTPAPLMQSLVLRLTFDDLLRIGVTQNHLATAGVIVGTVFGFLFTVAGAFEQDLVKTLIERWPMLKPGFWGFLILAGMLFVLAFFLTLMRTVTQHYDLQFFESREGFQLKAGLFNRREASMQKRKIQLIRWTDNPLRRLLGLFRVSIHQAISGSERAAEQISIPGCKTRQVDDVVHSSFEESANAEFQQHTISRAYFTWYIRFYALLPAVVFGALWYFLQEPRFALPAIAFPVLGALYLWTYQRRFRLWLSEEYLKTEEGVLGRTATLLPIYKVQSVRIRQSFFQRRRDLASVQLFTAGGSVYVPFLPLGLAQALQDYVLYRVESRQEDWM